MRRDILGSRCVQDSESEQLMTIRKLTDDPVVLRGGETLADMVKIVCEQAPTLVDAISAICIWESERAIKQAFKWKETGESTASHGGGWDTCFRVCIENVMEAWEEKKARESVTPIKLKEPPIKLKAEITIEHPGEMDDEKALALMVGIRMENWLWDRLESGTKCDCNNCKLCAYRYIERRLLRNGRG